MCRSGTICAEREEACCACAMAASIARCSSLVTTGGSARSFLPEFLAPLASFYPEHKHVQICGGSCGGSAHAFHWSILTLLASFYRSRHTKSALHKSFHWLLFCKAMVMYSTFRELSKLMRTGHFDFRNFPPPPSPPRRLSSTP